MSDSAAVTTLDDYLQMSFEGPDAEYVDGEVVERAMPKLSHSEVQQALAESFGPLRKAMGIAAGPEIRVRVGKQTIRVPDYCVFRSRPAEEVPSEPALLVVEVLSPSDAHSALMRKLEDYRAWGAENIWVIDPELRRLSVYRAEGLILVETLELAEYGIVLNPKELFA